MNAIPRKSRKTTGTWNKQDALIFSTLFLTAVEEMLLRAGRMKDRDGAKDWLNVRQGVGLAISDCVRTGCFESDPTDPSAFYHPTHYSNGTPVFEEDPERGAGWLRLNHPSGTPVEAWVEPEENKAGDA